MALISEAAKRNPSYIILSAVLFLLFIPSAQAVAGIVKKSSTVMGTDLEVTFTGSDAGRADDAFSAVAEEFSRIEREMSEWRDDTFVSRINRNAGVMAVKVPEELFNVIEASLTVSRLTDGAFDITWASMRGLWDFRPGYERVPSAAEVKGRLRLVDYRKVRTDKGERTVFLEERGMAIGLGAIAKGYAVDRAAEALARKGIKNAIVKAGGDMRVQGRDDGGPWRIGIRHPRERDRLLAKLPLTNISVSTSGDYERFFVKDGVLYHHIIDPSTGFPAERCRSVTIIAPDTMTSDALSTAVFVLGPEKGLRLVDSLKGVEALIVDSAGRVHTSKGLTPGG